MTKMLHPTVEIQCRCECGSEHDDWVVWVMNK